MYIVCIYWARRKDIKIERISVKKNESDDNERRKSEWASPNIYRIYVWIYMDIANSYSRADIDSIWITQYRRSSRQLIFHARISFCGCVSVYAGWWNDNDCAAGIFLDFILLPFFYWNCALFIHDAVHEIERFKFILHVYNHARTHIHTHSQRFTVWWFPLLCNCFFFMVALVVAVTSVLMYYHA